METKFTPGPWKIDFETVIDGEGGIFVYTGALVHPTTIAVCNSSTRLDRSSMEANAHVISAAPELYAALRDIAEYCSAEPATSSQSVIAQLAADALKKARGES